MSFSSSALIGVQTGDHCQTHRRRTGHSVVQALPLRHATRHRVPGIPDTSHWGMSGWMDLSHSTAVVSTGRSRLVTARFDPLMPPPRTAGYGSDRSREEVSFGSMPGDAAPPRVGRASPGRDAGAASPVGDALDVVAAVPAHERPMLLRPGATAIERRTGSWPLRNPIARLLWQVVVSAGCRSWWE
jgi:hypothetical protein